MISLANPSKIPCHQFGITSFEVTICFRVLFDAARNRRPLVYNKIAGRETGVKVIGFLNRLYGVNTVIGIKSQFFLPFQQ